MIAEEVTLSQEEWLNVGENTKRLLFKNSPIKTCLDKSLINISKVQKEFSIKQKELLFKYAKLDENGNIQTKVPGKDKNNLEDVLFKDEKSFKEELDKILSESINLKVYKVDGNLEYPYNGAIIKLSTYLEICTDIPAVDCLFLLEYYIK